MVRHCAIAIYASGYGNGSKEQRFWHCLDVARWRLVEYGYLRKGSQYGPPSNIVLTADGKSRETWHMREQGGAAKNRQFKYLYGLIETEVESLPMDRKPRNLKAAKARELYLAEKQAKKAKAAAQTPPPKRVANKTKKAKTGKPRRARTRRARRRT